MGGDGMGRVRGTRLARRQGGRAGPPQKAIF